MKKRVLIMSCICILLMPLRVSAAGVGDVYAALRDIGVPEEYVGQAAGLLARGTSDGAGVYRSDGTYYSYSDMVAYIYANQSLILAYCGLDGAAQTTEASVTENVLSEAVTEAPATETAVSEEIVTESLPVTELTETVTTTASTVTEAAAVTTVSATASGTAARTETVTSAVPDETAHHPSGRIAAAALSCILIAAAGFAALFRTILKQEKTGREQNPDS